MSHSFGDSKWLSQETEVLNVDSPHISAQATIREEEMTMITEWD